jgi:hypothetical protein
MNERSDPPTTPLHLVLDFGDTIDVDGSTIWDPIDEVTIPAVTLRLPAHRAAFLGRALDTYTRISHLLGTDPDLTERDLAWALTTAAGHAGHAPPPPRTAARSLDELARNAFSSDEEVDEFIAHTYAARHRNLT